MCINFIFLNKDFIKKNKDIFAEIQEVGQPIYSPSFQE